MSIHLARMISCLVAKQNGPKKRKKKRENKWGGQRKAHLVHVIHVHRFEAGNLAELPLFSVPARPPSCHPQTQQ